MEPVKGPSEQFLLWTAYVILVIAGIVALMLLHEGLVVDDAGGSVLLAQVVSSLKTLRKQLLSRDWEALGLSQSHPGSHVDRGSPDRGDDSARVAGCPGLGACKPSPSFAFGIPCAVPPLLVNDLARRFVTPSDRWRLGAERPGVSPEFPALVGGSAQVFLAAAYMILCRLVR
jgi:hypothetical protein